MRRRLVSLWIMLLAFLPQLIASDYGLASNCQDGVILHCFNWKYNDIKAELPNIAAAGFTSVQTSPAQGNGSGEWYWLYQPYDLAVGTNGLGTRNDLEALCDEAEKYGIKVIVDVVANHLNGSMDYVESRWRKDEYWHTHGGNIDYSNRWQVTHGEIGMRDLNSEHSYVQEQARKYVDDLYSLGVDGIRWDAAKHIGLPSESCQFWPKVCRTDMFHYGEILVGPVDNGGDAQMKEYTDYMTVTDSSYGKTLRDALSGGSTPSAYANWAARGISSDKIIYWAESHDTWANGYDWGYSHGLSQNVIDRSYALVASRADATSLYFSRPSTSNKPDIKIGAKGSTAFKNKEVAAVNHFHNAMIGQKDYYVSENGNAAVCREKGAVVVKGSGSGFVSISNGGSLTKPGTYKDEITGNTWTITSSKIEGQVGSTGIAVIYDYENAGHNGGNNGGNNDDDNNQGSESDPVLNSGEHAAFFENTAGWSTVYAWVWDDTQNYTGGNWPGQTCTNVGGNVWKWTASTAIPNGAKIIFNNGTGGSAGNGQTADLDWVNGGYYNLNGYVKTITPSTGNDDQGGNDDNQGENDDNQGGTDDLKPGNTGDYTGDYTLSGKSLNTDYYKTNPNGKAGTNKTINMSFSNGVSSTALSNWTESELISQGTARDIAQAMKGHHERPIYDTYSLYAAYDDNYLYLGWQFVYLIWDLYGEGKQPGESKPHNGDIRQMIALDLDPSKSCDGVMGDGNTIWDADGAYNTFDNGADCFLLFSSKPTNGTPGIFFPDANGKCSYDAPYCLSFEKNSYGYQDGLLPSITSIYGQESFGFEPSVLEGTTGFVDLISEIDKSAHTFYEMKIPLSKLGITKEHIESTGIGVMHISTFGQGATGSLPYDDTVYDNVKSDYSKDPSSSAEKEDTDVFTYAMARVGKLPSSSTTPSKAPVVTATPGSGSTFVESISVTLTAEPSCEIYYTTDGSTPTASSKAYSDALTFTETTTLKTFVSDANGERVQTFKFTKGAGNNNNNNNDDNKEEDNNGIVMNPGEHAAFFENTVGWGSVYAWVWDDTQNYTGGNWPGQTCTNVSGNVWKWTASTAIPNGAKIIFSNGTGGSAGNGQTADLDWVNGGYYTLDGYVKTITPSTGNDDQGGNDDNKPVSNDWVASFKNTPNWSAVYAYSWDNSDTNNKALGEWPGKQINLNSSTGYYEVTIPGAGLMTTPMIIFNNGTGGSAGNGQTADYTLVNFGIYDMTGLIGSEVEEIAPSSELKIYGSAGRLFVVSEEARTITIVSADGRVVKRNINEGVNIIDDLSRGFYIVERTKVIL